MKYKGVQRSRNEYKGRTDSKSPTGPDKSNITSSQTEAAAPRFGLLVRPSP